MPTLRFDDQFTVRAGAFLRKLRGGASHDQLCAGDQVMYEAFRIATESSTVRWMLEALVMADLQSDQICDRFGWVGSSASVVQVYEEVFFDVRSRLKRSAYVMSHLIDMGAVHGGSAPDHLMWRLTAWQGMRAGRGAELFDAYVEASPLDSQSQEWLDNMIRGQLTRRAARTSLRLSGLEDPERAVDLIRTDIDVRREDALARTKLPGGSDAADSSRRKALIDALSISVADISKATEAASNPIEPRALDSLTSDIMKRLARSTGQEAPKELPGSGTAD